MSDGKIRPRSAAKHLEAWKLLQAGKSASEISRSLGLNSGQVQRLAIAFREGLAFTDVVELEPAEPVAPTNDKPLPESIPPPRPITSPRQQYAGTIVGPHKGLDNPLLQGLRDSTRKALEAIQPHLRSKVVRTTSDEPCPKCGTMHAVEVVEIHPTKVDLTGLAKTMATLADLEAREALKEAWDEGLLDDSTRSLQELVKDAQRQMVFASHQLTGLALNRSYLAPDQVDRAMLLIRGQKESMAALAEYVRILQKLGTLQPLERLEAMRDSMIRTLAEAERDGLIGEGVGEVIWKNFAESAQTDSRIGGSS